MGRSLLFAPLADSRSTLNLRLQAAKGTVIALAVAGAWKVWHNGEKAKHAAFYEAYNKSLAGKDLQGDR